MANPFADLIPQASPQMPTMSAGAQNPFDDLVPANASRVTRGTSAPIFGSAASTMPTDEGNEDNRGFLNNFARHQVANLGTYGRSLVNAPHHIYSGIPAVVPDDFDYYKAMGVTPGLGDKITEGSLEFSPYLAGVGGAAKLGAKGIETLAKSEPGLANLFQKGASILSKTPNLSKQVAAGVGYGAVNAPQGDKIMGALAGGASAALGVGTGKLGDIGFRKLAEKYAQSAVPGLLDNATNAIKKYITPEQSAKLLQDNYTKAANENAANWNAVNGLSGSLDNELSQSGKTFNTEPFQKTITDFLDNTKKMEPAVQAKYKNAMDFANHINDQAPQSFSGAVALRQNLNQELKKYLEKQNIKTTDKETGGLITKLKSGLQDTVNANKGNVDNDLLNQFGDTWEKANASHAALQDFVKTPNPQGVLKPRIPRREALNAGSLDTGGLSQYIRPALKGISGIDQLNKLTGNNQSAPSYVMRNIIEGRGNQNPLTPYEALSPAQRQTLFANTTAGNNLEAAHQARMAFGNPTDSGWGAALGHHALSLGVPGLAAFLGAKTLGHQDWDTSLGVGVGAALGAKGASKLVSKFATPSSVMKAIQRAKTPGRKPGRYLSPVLASMFTPKEAQ